MSSGWTSLRTKSSIQSSCSWNSGSVSKSHAIVGLQSVEVIRASFRTLTQLFQIISLVCYRRLVDVNGSSGRDALVNSARRLFAEQGIDAVSLREVARAAGHRNTNAVQYHFGDRQALLVAVVEPFEHDVGERRAALVDMLATEPVPSMRSIAGALVRPSAAMLETP